MEEQMSEELQPTTVSVVAANEHLDYASFTPSTIRTTSTVNPGPLTMPVVQRREVQQTVPFLHVLCIIV